MSIADPPVQEVMAKVGETMSSARYEMGRSKTRARHKPGPGEDCSYCDREGRTSSGCLWGTLRNVLSPGDLESG